MPPTAASPVSPIPRWLAALSRLPPAVLYAAGACLAFLAYRVLRYRLAVVRANLDSALPELTVRERRGIERTYYERLGELAAEVLMSASLSEADLARRVVFANPAVLRGPLEAGRGVLVVAAHQCNWEWLLLGLASEFDYPLLAAYKPLHDPRSEHVMRALRTRCGAILVPAKEVLTAVLRRRGARIVAMVADQEPVSSEYKWWTRFLGRPTAFYMGAEKIAQLAHLTVVFAGLRRIARGRYQVDFEMLGENSSHSAGQITERYVRCVERQIRESPADWTWSHRRWKLRRPVYSAAASALDQGPG